MTLQGNVNTEGFTQPKRKLMALYTTLPIYKDCYDFLLRIMQVISHYPKEYKFTLGERIQNAAIDMVISIYRANSTKYKSQHIRSMLNYIQHLYLFLRISHDMKIINTEKYSSIVLSIDNISRQAQGWLNANEKPPEPVQATV